MQFMEPLGATDGSVEAAWDHLSDRWRGAVLSEEIVSRLSRFSYRLRCALILAEKRRSPFPHGFPEAGRGLRWPTR